MTTAMFFYGTLCHAPLREAVLGLGHVVSEARLSGYGVHWAEGQDFPVIMPGEGTAAGLLVESIDGTAKARADWFEGGFGYRLADDRQIRERHRHHVLQSCHRAIVAQVR